METVETIVADHSPHKSARALLRIRLAPWMSGERAGYQDKNFKPLECQVTAFGKIIVYSKCCCNVRTWTVAAWERRFLIRL